MSVSRPFCPSAAQVNVEALPDGPENPYGNGFIPVETDLTSELKAQRVCDPACARLWKIKNPESLHPVTGGCHPLPQITVYEKCSDKKSRIVLTGSTGGCHDVLWCILAPLQQSRGVALYCS